MPVQDQGTTLWTLMKDGREVTCQVRLVPYGIEVDIIHDGSTLITRTFETDAEALTWAERKREDREAQGWLPATPAGGSSGRSHDESPS